MTTPSTAAATTTASRSRSSRPNSPRTWLAGAGLEPVPYFSEGGGLDEDRLRRELARRKRLYLAGRLDPLARAFLARRAEADPLFFLDQFVFGYDPRRLLHLPLVAWPRQREYVAFLHECATAGRELVVEKARDVGVTSLTCAYALWRWRFAPGFKTTFCANKLDLVDARGNPDSIFEKLRLILRALPAWLAPEGFAWARHDREARLLTPANGNVVTGEGGDNAGRGGRSTWWTRRRTSSAPRR